MSGGLHIVGDQLLKRRHSKINRQGVKPVIQAVDSCQSLNTLATSRQIITVVIRIHVIGQAPLAQVADALSGARLLFASRQGGQEHRRQNGDYRDDHEELDKRERVTGHAPALTRMETANSRIELFHRA